MNSLINNLVNTYKISNSKFISFSFYVESENEIKQYLNNIKKEYYDSSHICYAYIIGSNQNIQKFNDDNEPTKTAGFPILELLLKENLTNCLVIVVRYFGGTKLGASNLARSYLKSAQLVIKNNIQEYIIYNNQIIIFNYSDIKNIDHFIKQNNLIIINKIFKDKIWYEIKVPKKFIFPDYIKSFLAN